MTVTTNRYITAEQLDQYDRNGFIVLPAVFSDDEVRQMRTEADYIIELIINSSIANKRISGRLEWRVRPDGTQIVRKIQPINDLSIYLSRISEDPRLIEPMRIIMGDEPELLEEKLNYKQTLPQRIEGLEVSENSDDRFPIHHDWAYYRHEGYPQTVISSAISLDTCAEDSGPMHVWPGSHRQDFGHDIDAATGFDRLVEQIDPDAGTDVLCPPGSVMLFHVMLVHNSRANTSGRPRRMMIYSHCPRGAAMPPDARNGLHRRLEGPWERQYERMKTAGVFRDVCKAPVVPGCEAADTRWITGK